MIVLVSDEVVAKENQELYEAASEVLAFFED